MKKRNLSLLAFFLAFVMSLGMFFQGYAGTGAYGKKKKKPVATSTVEIQSAVKNSFNDVTANLDKGGNFYMYASTEKIMEALDTFAVQLRGILGNFAGESKDMKEGLMAFDVIYNLYNKIGIKEVSGIGISSIALRENLNHSKFMVHHYPENNKGLIWQLNTTAPHPLECLKMLPAKTVLAGFGDNKLKTFWSWLKQEAPTLGIPELEKGLQKVESKLMEKKIDLNRIIDSFAGPSGFLLTLDEENMKTVPIEKDVILEIPEPALAIVFSVKDDYLFNLIQGMIPMGKKSEDANGKKFQFDPLPMPFNLQPTMVLSNGRLIIASNGAVVEQMMDALKKGNGLTMTDEFNQLSAHMPEKGNGFDYSSPRFGKLIWQAIEKAGIMNKQKDKSQAEISKFISGLFPKEAGKFSIKENLPNGFLTTINHNTGIEHILLIPAAVATGVAAAVAIPNLLVAKEKSKQKATMSDMKNISAAIDSYIDDKKKAPEAKSLEELQKILQPFYIKELPLNDAWGKPFYYRHGEGKLKKSYSIASGGKDGEFKGWEQEGCFHVKDIDDFGNDLILTDGNFTYCPASKKSCEEKHEKEIQHKHEKPTQHKH